MDLDDAGALSPCRGPAYAAGGGASDVGALRQQPPPPQQPPPQQQPPPPQQPLPPHETPAPAGPPPLPSPPRLPPPQLPLPMVPTMSVALAPPAPPVPQQQVFTSPVFSPPAYAHAGAATAAATAAPVVIATRAPELHVVVPAGVVVGRSPPVGVSAAGAAPVSVTLPLGSVARPPAVLATTGPTVPTTPAGPPLFSPQQLDTALAIRLGRAALAARRQNPPAAPAPSAPPSLAYLPENAVPHPGGQQQFQPGVDQAHERQEGQGPADGSPRQHRLHGAPPPPFGW